MNNYYILAIILLLIIIFMLYMSSVTVKIVRPERKIPVKRLIGGCKGTRWGCCPDGVTGKVDPAGSNC